MVGTGLCGQASKVFGAKKKKKKLSALNVACGGGRRHGKAKHRIYAVIRFVTVWWVSNAMLAAAMGRTNQGSEDRPFSKLAPSVPERTVWSPPIKKKTVGPPGPGE